MSDFEPMRDGQHTTDPTVLTEKMHERLAENREKGHQVFNPLMGSGLKTQFSIDIGVVEVAAAHLIFFCKAREEGWKPLTGAELMEGTKNMVVDPYNPFSTGQACASVLIDDGYLVREGEDWDTSQIFFTSAFIDACLNALNVED
jgi:hypothetical protein